MASLIRCRWEPHFEGASRRDRGGCSYDAYIPDPVVGWGLSIPADLAADIADAETAIRQLNTGNAPHVSLEGLARFLLRAESVASSRIEGIEASPQRLMRAEALLAHGSDAADQAAAMIMANISAMTDAIDRASSPKRFELQDLLAIHRLLMEASDAASAGKIRTQQNWIGGSGYNPCSAAFVPPPPDRVPDLLDDLVAYLNGDEHPAVVQAAIVHAQFETIHPFIDGNGRTGRALVHVVLRRRGLAPRFVPPISLILATWAQTYVGGLTAFRHIHAPDSPERSSATHDWLRVFTTATKRASADATRYAGTIDDIEGQWRGRLGGVRANSTTDLLLRLLPGVPLLTVETAAALTQRSRVAASGAISQLTGAGVLVQRNIGRHRYRVFEAPDIVGLFTLLERSLASETGDTLTALPVRPVPRRPM